MIKKGKDRPSGFDEKTRKQFFALLQSGLWGTSIDETLFAAPIDWETIFRWSVEQTVIGVVGDGISNLSPGKRPSQQLLQKWMMHIILIEKANRKMNEVLGTLAHLFREHNIRFWVLKGQGMAENYPQPLHRQSGDIDLLVDASNYEKAKELLLSLPHAGADQLMKRLHFSLSINDVEVELHGDINLAINATIKRHFRAWLSDTLYNPEPSAFMLAHNMIPVPSVNFNVVYIFIHLFRHYIGGGVGYRQLCDWMLYLHTNKEAIEQGKLKRTLEDFHLLKAWQVFGTLVVKTLNCPSEDIPFYEPKYVEDACLICDEIFTLGNFGKLSKKFRNRPQNYWLRKCRSFYYNTSMQLHHFHLFPSETAYSLVHGWLVSINYVIHGK